MNVLQSGRRGGKTTYLIDQFLADPKNSVIITHDEAEAKRLRSIIRVQLTNKWMSVEDADSIALHGVISWASRESLRGQHKWIHVDNVDLILLQELSIGVKTVTLTGGDA